jgi:WD40 repeat protein
MTTSFDGTARFWDIRNGQCLKEIVHDKQPPM